MGYNVALALQYLNLFYTIEENTLLFNGHTTYASKELKHLRRQFGLGDKSVEILKDWCTLMGMTESGWLFSNINIHNGNLEAGYVWAPYIPLQVTTLIESEDYAPVKKLLSRYTTRMVNQNFYGIINGENL